MPLSWLLGFTRQSLVLLGLIMYRSNLHLLLHVAFFLCMFTWLSPCASQLSWTEIKGTPG